MLNFGRKKELANVIGLMCKPYFLDYTEVLKRLQTYFERVYGLRLEYVTYSDSDNRDISGKLARFNKILFSDVSMLRIDTNKKMDDERELCATFSESKSEVLISIMINLKYTVHLREILSALGAGGNIYFGFMYEIELGKELVDGYLLNSSDSKKNVVNLPGIRLKEKLLYAMRLNRAELINGVLKDIFRKNIITNRHLDRLKGTQFLQFVQDQSAIQPFTEGVYLIEFKDDAALEQARKLAYKERLVFGS